MQSLVIIIDTVIDLYMWVVIIWVIMSWLVSFQIVNTHNRFVYLLSDFLHRLTEPALAPIRRVVPFVGGLDLSPFVLILILYFLRLLLREYVFAAL
jgi:YggT family protein